MSTAKREKSNKYPGVYWRQDNTGEKMYYIRYRQGGRGSKEIEEPVGKSSSGMTEAKASVIRASRVSGKDTPNKVKRKNEQEKENKQYRLQDAWDEYGTIYTTRSQFRTDRSLIKHLQYLLHRPIESISTSDVDGLRKKLDNTTPHTNQKDEKKNLAPATIAHVIGLLRRLINFTVKRGHSSMPENLHFEMPKVDNQKTEVLTDDQLQRFLKALDEEEDQDAAALMRLALVTGMRKGALIALRWEDCDFERNIITLRGESAKKGTTDFIPMTPAAKAILEAIQERKSDYVFPGRNGGKRTDYRRIARRVKEKAGLPKDFRPLHGLRHNYASRLASSGDVELYTLQKLLTHSSPQMTQRYAHLRDETLMKAALIADKMMEKKVDND